MSDPQKVIDNLKQAQVLLRRLVADSEGDRRLSYKAALFAVEEALRTAEAELKEGVCV